MQRLNNFKARTQPLLLCLNHCMFTMDYNVYTSRYIGIVVAARYSNLRHYQVFGETIFLFMSFLNTTVISKSIPKCISRPVICTKDMLGSQVFGHVHSVLSLISNQTGYSASESDT